MLCIFFMLCKFHCFICFISVEHTDCAQMSWWWSRKKTTTSSAKEDSVSRTIHGIQCPLAMRRNLYLRHFQMHRAIGHGSSSTIFEAVYKSSNTPCVLKICMKTRLRPSDERRLRREINIHSTLLHPHILSFYASFEDESAFYLVLEIAPKGDLLSHIKHNGYMTVSDFKHRVLFPILNAVDYLQQRNIMHRDIKPENILVCKEGTIKLCDFGFSINRYDERPHSRVGTLEYMAPELVSGKVDTFDEKIDIWAIGVLTYECIAGVSPFYHPNDQEIVQAIIDCKYSIPANFPKELVEFLDQIFRKKPEDRATLAELLRHRFLATSAIIADLLAYKQIRIY